MKYTVGSPNTVFPGCLKQNMPRWPASHRSKKGTNIVFLPSGYFMIDSHFIFFLSWGCSISFVCYIFVISHLLYKIPYSYKVSLDLKIKQGTEALFNWPWTCREKLTLNTKEFIESLFQVVLLTEYTSHQNNLWNRLGL